MKNKWIWIALVLVVLGGVAYYFRTDIAKSVLKCNTISQTAPLASISKKLLKITRWPELLIGKNSVMPCIRPSMIDFINIFSSDVIYRANEAGEMMESISATTFSVN